MAGIYIHIPFCKQACIYCNFHFKAGNHNTSTMSEAIAKEITLRKSYLSDNQVTTIYLGGGTPSLLPIQELERIIQSVYKNFSVSEKAEITLEANPDDLSKEKLLSLKQLGINRLSMGVQTFDDKALRWMNRAHSSREAVEAITMAQEIGIENISIDLITGIPVTDNLQHKRDVAQALALNPTHISCYSLTLEPKTSWERLIRTKNYPEPKEDEQAKAFLETIELIESEGWLHYEISNFAKNEACVSKHNSSYWEGEPYLGVGPSAHSFDGTERSWNLTNHPLYLDAIGKDTVPPSEKEFITPKMAFNEALMTGLRTAKGVSLSQLETLLPNAYEKVLQKIKQAPFDTQVRIENNRLKLTHQAKLFADAIASDLFVE